MFASNRLASVLLLLTIIGVMTNGQAEDRRFDPNQGVVIVEQQNQSGYMKGFPPPEDKLIDGYSMEWILDPDKSRWAMQNMSKILHTAVVSRGSRPIVYLPRNDKGLLDKHFKDIHGQSLPLRRLLKVMEVDGFIALKDGQILVEAYYNGYRPEKHHEMMSVTKSLVGTLIGVLVGEGKLRTDRLIPYYLPVLEETGWGDATLRQTLDMTTGIAWNEDHTDENSHIIQATTAVGLQHVRPDYLFNNGISLLKSVAKEYEHGQVFDYRSGNTEALGWLITRHFNEYWHNVFSEKIWSKLGAEYDALILVDSTGQGAAHAGFNATLRDMARFAVMMAQNGYYNDQQIVPKDWIDDIRYGDDDSRRAWQESSEREIYGDSTFYRSQYRVLDSEKGIFIAIGAKGQMLYINVSENLAGVFQSTTEGISDNNIRYQQIGIMEQISRYLKQEK